MLHLRAGKLNTTCGGVDGVPSVDGEAAAFAEFELPHVEPSVVATALLDLDDSSAQGRSPGSSWRAPLVSVSQGTVLPAGSTTTAQPLRQELQLPANASMLLKSAAGKAPREIFVWTAASHDKETETYRIALLGRDPRIVVYICRLPPSPALRNLV